MSEQTYDDGRARNLEALLVALARRIQELEAGGELLKHAGELTQLIGHIRSELFHYEVRVTYDTPEIAESRRIGLAHRCIAFVRPHRDTVSIPDRPVSSCMEWARRVPSGVNWVNAQQARNCW